MNMKFLNEIIEIDKIEGIFKLQDELIIIESKTY